MSMKTHSIRDKNDRACTVQAQSSLHPPHSIFSTQDKYALLLLVAAIGFWSGVSTPIYYPALQVLESYFNISEELVNVSVVVYLIAQGVAPTVFATFADNFGRRPVLLVCLIGFTCICVGLALAQNYATILVLRIIQSSFIAPAIAISSGAVGDFTEIHERGGYVGLLSALLLVGQGIGALIGAALISRFDWRSIFWFLAIGGGATLFVSIFALHETGRNIVGNGSVIPGRWINRAPLLHLPSIIRRWKLQDPDSDTIVVLKTKTDFLAPFRIMSRLELYICLFTQAMHFVIWTLMLTSLTTQLSKEYHYSVMHIGLCYLPSGILGLIGAVTAGRLLDWNYKRTQKRSSNINILRSRVEVAIPFMIITDVFALMFGWCLQKRAHIATILVSSGLISLGCLAGMGVNTTLLIDLYPDAGSAATSSINFTRCLHAAVFVAALTSMNKAMGIGGTFTFVAVVGILSCVSLVIPVKYGMKWAAARERKKKESK